ncbi:hypothetical protein EXN66_Car012422 [Channa argus]|uniref:Uncharacterized protein n=1 Tax=Channa argus TaxID=215402 RepID=A0A6G1Q2X4_CHAAH|nr:hypothetical protein EXN66_Car012422 [Channa argus]
MRIIPNDELKQHDDGDNNEMVKAHWTFFIPPLFITTTGELFSSTINVFNFLYCLSGPKHQAMWQGRIIVVDHAICQQMMTLLEQIKLWLINLDPESMDAVGFIRQIEEEKSKREQAETYSMQLYMRAVLSQQGLDVRINSIDDNSFCLSKRIVEEVQKNVWFLMTNQFYNVNCLHHRIPLSQEPQCSDEGHEEMDGGSDERDGGKVAAAKIMVLKKQEFWKQDREQLLSIIKG